MVENCWTIIVRYVIVLFLLKQWMLLDYLFQELLKYYLGDFVFYLLASITRLEYWNLANSWLD